LRVGLRSVGMTIPVQRGPAEPAMSLRGLVKRFDTTVAVAGLDLDVPAGSFYGLLGPNGAGKTTTIRILTTLLPIGRGVAHVLGHDVARERMTVRRQIGYVPQQLSADGALTGRENMMLFARLFDVPRAQRAERVDVALEATGMLEPADRLVSTYSGGMIRRLELAQALVNRPRVLILDEPTIGLDPIARTSVWELIARLREESGMTVLLTTHYMDEADELCERIALMHRGRLRAVGSPAELKAALGPGATLDDVFRHHAGDLTDDESRGLRDVRSTRRTAIRLG
jgi:ABC-2 type transport system ATP-binding protein